MSNKLLFVTTKKENSVALLKAKQRFIEKIDGRVTSKEILVKIDKLLQDAKLEIKDLNEIVVDLGPGSYTGVKIGLTVISALNFNRQIKTFSTNSFEIMLGKIKSRKPVLLDAKLDEFYYYEPITKEITIHNNIELSKFLEADVIADHNIANKINCLAVDYDALDLLQADCHEDLKLKPLILTRKTY